MAEPEKPSQTRDRASSEPTAASDPYGDRMLRIETPEHVSVSFPLAGPGSRFGALALDTLILIGLLLALLLVLLLLAGVGWIGESLIPPMMIAGLVFALFGYFFAIELVRNGQTIGKSVFGIRTVRDGGHPIDAQASAIRNLVRIVDIQPVTSCLLGGMAILLDGKSRRLGDLAAGTVVVRDLPIEFPEVPDVGVVGEPPRLADPAWTALENFVERAAELPEASARKLARRLLKSLDKVGAPAPESGDPVAAVVAFYEQERARRAGARLSTAVGSAAAASLLRVKRERWTELRDSVRVLKRRRLRRLDEGEVSRFAARYRALSADLARARTYGASPRTLFALEQLVASAHSLFYRPVRQGARKLGRFLVAGMPRLFRRLRKPIGISAAAFFVPMVISYLLVLGQEDNERLLASAEMIQRAEAAAADPTLDYRDTWGMEFPGEVALTTYLIANNVRVALLCFAGGVLAGVGSLLLLAFNGVSLGVGFATFANRGVLDVILMFVISHGAIELMAIAIAGGAGFWMGSAVWFPGRAPRRVALAERAREAVALVLGVIGLLVIAGLVEGFISPSRLPEAVKIVAALAALAWLTAYLGLGGRRSDDGDVPGVTADRAT
ncbi:MAG: stage II sporulation protein M [Planctomycetota bacterium]